jgi:Mg2+ and Co2+ transporter CorA
VKLRATLYDASGRDRDVELGPEVVSKLGPQQLLWIDLDGREVEAVERVAASLDLPRDSIQHLLEASGTARLLRYPGLVHLHLVAVQPADPNAGESRRGPTLQTAPIDIMAGPNVVVTVHDGAVHAFDAFVAHIRGDSHLGELDAAGFMGALVDSVLSVYLGIIEAIERRIDVLDELALRGGRPETFLSEVVTLRRRISALRRTLAPHRAAFGPLARPDLHVPELGRPWPGLVERLERTVDATESARDLLLGSFDVYMARAAHRTNNVMKVLTVLNAILLPSIVLAGVMGMNFKIPFFDDPNNFWLVVGGMLGLATAVVGMSRWRGWL